MDKAKLVDTVYAKTPHGKEFVRGIIETTIQTIINKLQNGEEVAIRGFMKFRIINRPAYEVNNFGNGKKVIPASKAIKCSVSDKIKVGGQKPSKKAKK